MGWLPEEASGFRGIVKDLKRRAPKYVSDWTEGHNAKTTAYTKLIQR